MDYARLFSDWNIDYSVRINRGWVNIDCPYCGEHKHSYNMGFNPVEDYCNCWKCGYHGLLSTLSMVLHVSSRDVKSVLEAYKGVGKGVAPSTRRSNPDLELELPSDGFTDRERRYLIKRRFDPDFLHDKYGVVGGGFNRQWHDRIIIPVTYGGDVVSWVGRSVLSSKALKETGIPRYKNLSIEQSKVNPKDILFNLDNCKGKSVVLTEGCFDVFRLGDGFVCSLGTQLTQSQIRILSERFSKVFLMFDNEPEAQDKAKSYGLQLASMGLDVEVVDAYSEYGVNDGGDCNEEQVAEIRSELGIA